MPSDRVTAGLESIGANTRRLRLARRWTQEHLAELANVETRTIRKLETGTANPTAEVLLEIAAAFGVYPGVLFRRAKLPERRPGRPPLRRRVD